MSRINKLAPEVFNMIAAGEVVENPSSIVKELVENSIDAGATEITVRCEGGGKESLVVTDNGIGIEYDDIELAFTPHSTSKITSAVDLSQISTLGFRGEALPSIASVSKVEVFSRFHKDKEGTHLVIEGGKVILKEHYPWREGTLIAVNNLFYNVPARQKFLKANHIEEKYIRDKLRDLIFAQPKTHIRFNNEKETVIMNNGGNLDDAILEIYGSKIADNMLTVSHKLSSGIKVEGRISKPDVTKSNRTYQTLIINGRVVNDKKLQVAIEKAYMPRLMTKAFSIYVLQITMPFDEVDINVHPTKYEVRFVEFERVFSAVYHAVQEALVKYDICKEVRVKKPEEQIKFEQVKTSFLETIQQEAIEFQKVQNTIPEAEEPKPMQTQFETERFFGNIVGQILGTYLVVEIDDMVYFIDQHAAHERIRYDNMMRAFENNKSIEMLVPFTYKMNAKEEDYVTKIMTSLREIGFDISIAEGVLKISKIPEVIASFSSEKILSLIFENMFDTTEKGITDFIKDLFASRACKGAIKGGDSLNREQIGYLLKELETEHSYFPAQCPHGRPCIVKYTKEDFEKLFKRIV